MIETDEASLAGNLAKVGQFTCGRIEPSPYHCALGFIGDLHFHLDPFQIVVGTPVSQQVVVCSGVYSYDRINVHLPREAEIMHPACTTFDTEKVIVIAGTDRYSIGFLVVDSCRQSLVASHGWRHA